MAGIWIHDTTIKPSATRHQISVSPEVSEFPSVAGDNEDRRGRYLRDPSSLRRSVALREPHLAQCRLETLADNPAVAEADFVHACEAIRRQSVPTTVDDEHANSGKREDRLAAPLVHKLRRRHREAGERSAVGMREDASQRDKRLARSALCNNRRTPGLLPTLNDTHHGHCLGGEGPSLQLLQFRPYRSVRSMKRRKTRKHAFSERLAVDAEIVLDCCGCRHDNSSFVKAVR